MRDWTGWTIWLDTGRGMVPLGPWSEKTWKRYREAGAKVWLSEQRDHEGGQLQPREHSASYRGPRPHDAGCEDLSWNPYYDGARF